MSQLSIGQLARASGIGVETTRFHEREGLIADPARPYSLRLRGKMTTKV